MFRVIALALFASALHAQAPAREILLVIQADDLGAAHGINVAAIEA